MRPKRPWPPPEKTCLDFSLVFYINLNCSKTNGRNSRTHVESCSLIDQGLTWVFAIGCETIRLTHATLLAKLATNADNTSWGTAWMKCKGAAFLQRSTNSDETFLRGLYAWSIAEPNRNILAQDMINPKRTMQWSAMQQRNVSHSTIGIVANGCAKPGKSKPVTRGDEAPLENFLPPLEKCVGYSLKILDVVQKFWVPQKTLRPSWCPKLVTGRIFTKCDLIRWIRGFQPITVRITFQIIDEACPATPT